MADKVAAGHVGGANGAREAVCIHTKKIYSSCRDKDCIEDLRFYPTATAQSVLSTAQGLRGGSAELIYTFVDVEPVNFNRGYLHNPPCERHSRRTGRTPGSRSPPDEAMAPSPVAAGPRHSSFWL